MTRNIILLMILLLYLFGTSMQNNGLIFTDYKGIDAKITRLKKLKKDLNEQNNKLIIRQLIDKRLDRVVDLFNHNLALTKDDLKLDPNNTDFRSRLSKILAELKIENKGIKQESAIKKASITYIPYELKIKCTFGEFAELINALEKNERIIIVNKFKFSGNVKKITKFKKNLEDIMRHDVELDISTVTLSSKEVK